MNFKVYEDSKNYTATIVKLNATFPLPGLDNLVGTSVFGNICLVPKYYNTEDLYVFFPSECQLSATYLKSNNLYRENTYNEDPTQKGYFEENGRVKAIKFKGNKSTGIIMPLRSLWLAGASVKGSDGVYKAGDEFNEVEGVEICRKYVVKTNKTPGSGSMKSTRILDSLIDSKMFPEHHDTSHLLKNLHKFEMNDNIVITTKLHGTSERVGNTLVKRKLNLIERISKFFGAKVQEEEYKLVVGSRRCVKSIAFEELKGKNHFYSEDLWTRVAQENFDGKLNKGEMVYFEVIGKDYNGAAIQGGYTYGFEKPTVFIYRISNINPQGIEIDLTWDQVKKRSIELGLQYVPQQFNGNLAEGFLLPMERDENFRECFENILKSTMYLDRPSMFDNKVIEEGICVRKEGYPYPEIYKLKSPLFLIHESKQNDAGVADVESCEIVNENNA